MKRELGGRRTGCWKGYSWTDENGMKQDKRGLPRYACTVCVILGHRDKRGRELKGHQHSAVCCTLSHVICTTDLWDGNLHPHFAGKPATRFTTKFKWKVLVILWNFLLRCSEISWWSQAGAAGSYKVLQRQEILPFGSSHALYVT